MTKSKTVAKKPAGTKTVTAAEVRTRRSNSNDIETEAMLFQGANITQLSKLFGMEKRDITPKIIDVFPVGKRGGYDIYSVKEVAPFLVKPLYDVETYIRRMSFKDLPKELSKEFWAGQRAKQEFDIKAGNLWSTEQVIEKFGDAVKVLRMGMLLIPDTLARQAGLTEAQRTVVQSSVDSMLTDLANALIKSFEEDTEDDDDEV